MNTKILSVENLNVVYKTDEETVRAVNGISFEVLKGETLGIVGETGAGKTTTALSIMGLLPQNSGRIETGSIVLNDENLLKKSEAGMRRIRGNKVSMIFQDPMTSLNPILQVGEQIAEVLELHNWGKRNKQQIEERVEELFKLVGIPVSRKSDYPHQFSGGMKQRIVIAMALACNPELIIADEPTTALDVTIQAQVLKMMDNLKQTFNTAMILITHDLGIIAQMCDKVAVMYAGEIVEYGTIYDIFMAEKHHPYTKGLFGSIPNITEQTKRLNPIEGLMPDPANLPQGCKFHPRCKKCMDICKTTQAQYYINGTQKIKCHLYLK
jgi:peptide/nickel transport system ATP-binding protein